MRAAPVDLDFFCSRLKTSVSTWSSAEQLLVLTIASGGEERREGTGGGTARCTEEQLGVQRSS